MEKPWLTEPDKEEFEHAGLSCQLRRNGVGAWCAYVGVPPGHPDHGKSYHDLEEAIDVHGGLTFGSDSEEDKLWWFGFDCAHAYDVVPGLHPMISQDFPDTTYKDINFVRDNTKRLAEQLKERGLHGAAAETNQG